VAVPKLSQIVVWSAVGIRNAPSKWWQCILSIFLDFVFSARVFVAFRFPGITHFLFSTPFSLLDVSVKDSPGPADLGGGTDCRPPVFNFVSLDYPRTYIRLRNEKQSPLFY